MGVCCIGALGLAGVSLGYVASRGAFAAMITLSLELPALGCLVEVVAGSKAMTMSLLRRQGAAHCERVRAGKELQEQDGHGGERRGHRRARTAARGSASG